MTRNSGTTSIRGGVILGLLIAVPASSLDATWSIVAVDPVTREVGTAGASCTGFVAGIVGLAPGHGVIVAQARSNAKARERGVEMLMAGATPADILAVIIDPAFDPTASEQQYGIAALGPTPGVVAYTGTDTPELHGDIQGIHVSVQGNILASGEVLERTMEAFVNPGLEAPKLEERLLAALEAGSRAGGDARCGKQAALSAYLAVADPGDARGQPRVRIVVPGQRPGGRNPVEIVRAEYEELKVLRLDSAHK